MMVRTTSVNTSFFFLLGKRETSSTPVNTLSSNLGCFLVYEEKAADIWGAIN